MPDDESYGAADFEATDFEPGTDGLEDTEAEDDGVLDPEDALDGNPGDDPLDAGIIPADRWSAGERFGTTLAEEREGESLDQLLAEEVPDPDPYAEDEADPEAGLPAEGAEPYDEAQPRAGRWSPRMRARIPTPKPTWSPGTSASMGVPPGRKRRPCMSPVRTRTRSCRAE